MNKKRADNKKNVSYELHSNLMIATTLLAMAGFAVLMMINMSMRTPHLAMLSLRIASVGGVIAFAVAALLAYKAVKHNKKHFLEYIIYCIILGFGLTFMFNVPPFLVNFVYKNSINWGSSSLAALMIVTAVFFVVSVAWHGVLASPRKK